MKEIIKKINKFRDDRNWRQFHNEKDLAISISLESSELLELFQWKLSEETVSEKLPQIKEELADVFIYAFMLADNLNLDVEKIIADKIIVNSKKYPIKESFGYKIFIHCDEDIKKGEETAREKYRTELQDSIRYYTVTQYFFFKQWLALKEYDNSKGVKIIGDMPIYVSADSVEMWTMPELFKVDENNEPLYVAGCPADDFSPTGQLWGNPIYDWEKHKEQGFSWWIYRVQESFKIYDVLRIDHFKGFSDFWQIDKDAENAVNGTWEAGPGIELFQKIKEQLGDLPIVAENLGFIDAKAEKLLDDSGYPGMKILQFAFPGEDNLDRPHHYTQNSVAYTGTHDNDVVNGWYEKLSESERKLVSEYLNRRDDEKITEAMIRGIYSSVSDYAIVTMQDLLDKDATSRMNVPSTVGGNWEWRMLAEDLTEERKEFLRNITVRYSRERV